MNNRILDIEKALEAELYTVALASALTLPDIMGKAMCNGSNNAEKYKEWFNKYVKPFYMLPHESNYIEDSINTVDMTGEICYKLRCSYLHAGTFELKGENLPVFILKTHKANDNDGTISLQRHIGEATVIVLDVKYLCMAICEAVKLCNRGELTSIDNIEWW